VTKVEADESAYPLAENTIGDREIAAAIEVLRSGRFTMGSRVREFEAAFADRLGAGHAVMVNSGSSANLLAVEVMLRGTGTRLRRWRAGDEVLVPALAWPTTVWPIAQLGLVPVLVDVDPDTLAIDLQSAASVVNSRTVGMFLIHVLGRAPSMQPYVDFCNSHGLTLVEDSCESLGAYSGDTHVGTFGELGTFSSYFSHHITTIEGGLLVTDDGGVADDLRSMRSHGWTRDRSDRIEQAQSASHIDDRFLFATTGYNVRSTDLNAAIGLVQLDRLDEMLQSRAHLARLVAGWLSDVPWLELIGSECLVGDEAGSPAHPTNSWMNLPLRIQPGAPVSVTEAKRVLEHSGIETRPIIAGNLVHHPAMDLISFRRATSLAVADSLLTDAFMIGCLPTATAAQLETLEAGIRGLVER
jgi:CDP-6-deoxy-D-xylo-4-hexulose-3-dehydrase